MKALVFLFLGSLIFSYHSFAGDNDGPARPGNTTLAQCLIAIRANCRPVGKQGLFWSQKAKELSVTNVVYKKDRGEIRYYPEKNAFTFVNYERVTPRVAVPALDLELEQILRAHVAACRTRLATFVQTAETAELTAVSNACWFGNDERELFDIWSLSSIELQFRELADEITAKARANARLRRLEAIQDNLRRHNDQLRDEFEKEARKGHK